MNKVIKDTIKLVNYAREKQTSFIFNPVYICEELAITMKGLSQSKVTTIPEIIIWDDKYTDSQNQYTFSFERNQLNISNIVDSSLTSWWENFSYPLGFPINRTFFKNRIAFRYKNNFIIIDYDGYAMDIVLLPKTYIKGLSDAKEGSIKNITKEQYLSFRSFVNDLKVAMKELRPIPGQIIIQVDDKNIDLILDDVSINLSNCEYNCNDKSISFIVINKSDDSRYIFKFESENEDYIMAIKLLTEI